MHTMPTSDAPGPRRCNRPASPVRAARQRPAERSRPAGPVIVIIVAALSCCAGRALGNTTGDEAPGRLDLTLEDSVVLALKNNRRLLNARLDREVERFSLRVAENTFRPHVTIGPYVARRHTDPSTDVDTAGLATRVRLRLPTGGELGLDWEYGGRWTGSGSGGVPAQPRHANALTFTFTQPLLRGEVVRVSSQAAAGDRHGSALPAFEVAAVVEDLTQAQRGLLRLGMSARMEVVVYEKADALLVPIGAVDTGGGRPRLRVRDRDSGEVRLVEVVTGTTTLDSVEIVEGLSAGDEILVGRS